jgi:ABC-type uncharacterized transport system permease subunit
MPPSCTDHPIPVNRLLISTITAICSAGAGLGYAASREPLVLLTVLVGVALMGAAVGIGTGLALGLADAISTWIRRRVNGAESKPQANLQRHEREANPLDPIS